MSQTLTVDSVGRVVLPKRIRDKMHLSAGAKLRIEMVGDKLELSQEVSQVKIEQKKDGLPTIIGWDGFDAAQAVREMREEQIERLDATGNK